MSTPYLAKKLLEKEEYIQAIERYLKVTLGIPDYYLHNEESGVIPMTDHKFQRKTGNSYSSGGSAGGLVKPSTGYAFLRILKDSNAIVKSLELNGHPFELPNTAHRYKIFDRVMLHVIQHHGSRCHSIFSDLFIKNNIQRIFGFLTKQIMFSPTWKLMATLPLFLFLKSYVQTIIFKKTQLLTLMSSFLSSHTGELFAITVAFLWAVSSILYSRIGKVIPPLELNFLKGVLALAFVICYTAYYRPDN
ncbi:MAG: lycopene cyclase family protein [Ignavibacteriales bacterium]|nr:lycopene cyclase family protein [Ignavibacteriales bacterium]